MTAMNLAQCIGGTLIIVGVLAIGAGFKRTGYGLTLAALISVFAALIATDASLWKIGPNGALIVGFGIAFGRSLTKHRNKEGAR